MFDAVSENFNFGKVIVLFFGMMLVSCSTSSKKTAPCFDGWTTEGDDVSEVVSPPVEFFDRLRIAVDVENDSVRCVHYLPQQGKYIIIIDGDEVHLNTVIIQDNNGSFELLEFGIIT